MFKICLSILSLATLASSSRLGTVVINENGELEASLETPESYEAADKSKLLAWGNFTNEINQTGWSYLEITTNENFDDFLQVKCCIINGV